MKFLSGILFFIFSIVANCFSQTIQNDTVRLSNLPPEGILLDKGWKFHEGDDTAWANPDFNDRDWQPIDPALDIKHIPQFQKTSIGWFRLKLFVDSTQLNEPLAIILSQVGASEIYLDGKLLFKFGIVSAEHKYEVPRYLLNQPNSMKLDKRQIQTIAVRYSYHQNFLIKYVFPNLCLKVALNSVSHAFTNYQRESRINLINAISEVSLWMLLSVISFCLYFSFRAQIAYLFMGAFAFGTFCTQFLEKIISPIFETTSFVILFLIPRFYCCFLYYSAWFEDVLPSLRPEEN